MTFGSARALIPLSPTWYFPFFCLQNSRIGAALCIHEVWFYTAMQLPLRCARLTIRKDLNLFDCKVHIIHTRFPSRLRTIILVNGRVCDIIGECFVPTDQFHLIRSWIHVMQFSKSWNRRRVLKLNRQAAWCKLTVKIIKCVFCIIWLSSAQSQLIYFPCQLNETMSTGTN